MDSSAEESFTWTDTSSDSIESHSMANSDGGVQKVKEGCTVTDNKHGKKKKSRQLTNFTSTGYEEDEGTKLNVKVEKELLGKELCDESFDIKKKIIKLEPESESEVPKKKKKLKHVESNRSESDAPDSYDESYLNLKVKLENTCPPSALKTKKKIKLSLDDPKKENDCSASEGNANQINGAQSDTNTSKRKKKKRKKESLSEHGGEVVINDKMDIEELNLDTSHVHSRTDITSNTTTLKDSSLSQSYTLQDDTCYSEISAIQGDENHSLHTSTLNNSRPLVSERKKDKLHKSTVVNQFKSDLVTQSADKRVPRLSERLMFEEDGEDTELSTYMDNKTSSNLKKFLKQNSHLQRVSQELPENSILSNDDEIWLLKCPKEFDVAAFYDIELNAQPKCKLKLNGQTYDGSLDEEQSYPEAFLNVKYNKCEMKRLSICGIINYRKRIPKAHLRDDNFMVNNQTNFIPLPEIKCRHPLFGSYYKKAIKIPAAVAQVLNSENPAVEHKRKKKKSKRARDVVDSHEEMNMRNNISISKCDIHIAPVAASTTRKKRKHDDDESPAPKRVKRIKHDPECADTWESEKAIEKTLFDF